MSTEPQPAAESAINRAIENLGNAKEAIVEGSWASAKVELDKARRQTLLAMGSLPESKCPPVGHTLYSATGRFD